MREAWRRATEGVRRALRDPTLAGTVLGAEFDACTFETFVRRMACADTLIHTWDFARATEQDEHLDPEGVAVATRILIPEDDDIRMPYAFGPKVSPADDADPQTRSAELPRSATLTFPGHWWLPACHQAGSLPERASTGFRTTGTIAA